MLKTPFILFFIAGTAPSLDEQLAQEKLLPCRVVFRNADMVPETGALEKCDGVFGKVPKRYAKEYPEADEAIKLFIEQREADAKLRAEDMKKSKAEVQASMQRDAETAANTAADHAKVAAKRAAVTEQAAKDAHTAAAAAKEAAENTEPTPTDATDKAAAAAASWQPNA